MLAAPKLKTMKVIRQKKKKKKRCGGPRGRGDSICGIGRVKTRDKIQAVSVMLSGTRSVRSGGNPGVPHTTKLVRKALHVVLAGKVIKPFCYYLSYSKGKHSAQDEFHGDFEWLFVTDNAEAISDDCGGATPICITTNFNRAIAIDGACWDSMFAVKVAARAWLVHTCFNGDWSTKRRPICCNRL